MQERYDQISSKEIGLGSFGVVFKARDLKDNRVVAIKRLIDRDDIDVREHARLEIAYLETIQNDASKRNKESHVVSLLDHFSWGGCHFLVFEALTLSLYDLILESQGLSLDLIRCISAQIIQGIDFLEEVGIVHCDLKPENVMLMAPAGVDVSGDPEWKVKIIDLGSAQYLDELPRLCYVQSRWYRAPEVHMGLPLDSKIDLWSLGCIMAELFTTKPLFLGIPSSKNQGIQWTPTEAALFDICRRLGPIPRDMLKDAIEIQKRNGCGEHLNLFDHDFRAALRDYECIHDAHSGLTSILGIVDARSSDVKIESDQPLNNVQVDEDEEILDDRTEVKIEKKKKKLLTLLNETQCENMAFLDFLKSLLQLDPAKRVNAKEAMLHFFIKNGKMAPKFPESPTSVRDLDLNELD